MAERPTRIHDRDARIVQQTLVPKQCAIHAVRGTAKWRRCIRCDVLILVEEEDGEAG